MAASTTLTPQERSLRAAIASNTSWARTTDRRARTLAASQAFLDKFEREVDPDGVLPPAERAKRAENARRAHYASMAYKSARARRARKQARRGSA